jgi:hypothetical protein
VSVISCSTNRPWAGNWVKELNWCTCNNTLSF